MQETTMVTTIGKMSKIILQYVWHFALWTWHNGVAVGVMVMAVVATVV
jgi:hypothetical protein